MNSLWISPCSPFAFVRQTLRCSVSTPVRVPMYVLPWLVTMLTCFCRRLESSSMNLRPAVEDILATFGPLREPAISSLVQLAATSLGFGHYHPCLARISRRPYYLEFIDRNSCIAFGTCLTLVARIRNKQRVTAWTFCNNVTVDHRIFLDSKMGSYFFNQSGEDFKVHPLFLDSTFKTSRMSSSGRFPVASISSTLVFPRTFRESYRETSIISDSTFSQIFSFGQFLARKRLARITGSSRRTMATIPRVLGRIELTE